MYTTTKDICDTLGVFSKTHANINRFAFDSRKIQKGDVFFALPGEKNDGHQYLKDVAHAKACAAIVHKDYQGHGYGLILMKVPDVKRAMQQLARKRLQFLGVKTLAITGSVGKTSTKEFLAQLLKPHMNIQYSPGSFNSQVTLPILALNFLPAELFIFECGMSLKSELAQLVQIVQPDIALLTNVSYSHAANFANIEEIAHEKFQIFSCDKTSIKIAHDDLKIYEFYTKDMITYSGDGVYQVQRVGDQYVVIEHGIASEPFSLPFYQPYLVDNFLAAYCAAREIGLSSSQILENAHKLKLADHRCNIFKINGVTIVDDAYNASLLSTTEALKHLPKGKRRIAILSEMKELGSFSKDHHRQLGYNALKYVDEVYCIGQEAKVIVDIFNKHRKKGVHFPSRKELSEYITNAFDEGDVVLIKGANSFRLWELTENLST